MKDLQLPLSLSLLLSSLLLLLFCKRQTSQGCLRFNLNNRLSLPHLQAPVCFQLWTEKSHVLSSLTAQTVSSSKINRLPTLLLLSLILQLLLSFSLLESQHCFLVARCPSYRQSAHTDTVAATLRQKLQTNLCLSISTLTSIRPAGPCTTGCPTAHQLLSVAGTTQLRLEPRVSCSPGGCHAMRSSRCLLEPWVWVIRASLLISSHPSSFLPPISLSYLFSHLFFLPSFCHIYSAIFSSSHLSVISIQPSFLPPISLSYLFSHLFFLPSLCHIYSAIFSSSHLSVVSIQPSFLPPISLSYLFSHLFFLPSLCRIYSAIFSSSHLSIVSIQPSFLPPISLSYLFSHLFFLPSLYRIYSAIFSSSHLSVVSIQPSFLPPISLSFLFSHLSTLPHINNRVLTTVPPPKAGQVKARVLYSSSIGCLTWFIHECMLWNCPSSFIHRGNPNTRGSFLSRECKCERINIHRRGP